MEVVDLSWVVSGQVKGNSKLGGQHARNEGFEVGIRMPQRRGGFIVVKSRKGKIS